MAEVADVQKELEAVISRLRDLEGRAASEALVVENTLLKEEVARLKREIRDLRDLRDLRDPAKIFIAKVQECHCGVNSWQLCIDGWFRCNDCGFPGK